MLIVRPVVEQDMPAVEALAKQAGSGLTNLTEDRDYLTALIANTQRSLRDAPDEFLARDSYHFVLEDLATDQVVGIAGVQSAIGITSPYYSYRIDEIVHASNELEIHNRMPALHLCQDYTGCSRFCSLFIAPEYRSPANLQLLSRARMMFMAQYPERFARRTVAELQGLLDENGQSPFWESLGRDFCNMEFAQADYLTAIDSKSFIADLMPRFPVYTTLLTPAARKALGQPRPDIEPVMDLLEDEGFVYRGYVDIFDAGPTIECRTSDIRTVDQSVCADVNVADTPADNEWVLVSNNRLLDYRCMLVPASADGLPVMSDEQVSALLAEAQIRTIPVAAAEIALG